jgi:hypothetical protein
MSEGPGSPDGFPPPGQGWPPQPQAQGWPPHSPPPSGGNGAVIAVVVAVVLLLAVGAVGVLLLLGRSDPGPVAVPATASAPPADPPADPSLAPPADPSGEVVGVACRAEEGLPDLGGGHIDPAALAEQPPALIYPDRPHTSGPHVGQVVATGVYDVVVDERITLHNLEHGYVVIHHAHDAPAEVVTALQGWAREAIAGDTPKIVVAPFPGDLPDAAQVALTAWHHRTTCTGFDQEAAERFLVDHHDLEGEAPERGLPPHEVGEPGVLDPDGADLLLPPLAAADLPGD